MELTTAYTDAWYRQPDPVEPDGDRRPTNEQWVLVAAVRLLAIWSPEQPPDWASILVPGRTKSREDQQWPEPPPLPEIADAGDLPSVTGASVLTSRTSTGPRRPYEPARTDEEVADELVTLISDVVGPRDHRGEALVRFLAGHLAGPHSDVLRLIESVRPGSLHLLHRDTWGSTLRLSLNPAPKIQQQPVITPEGPDAALRTRIACVLTLLSELLWVNNNNPVTFRFRIGRLPHGDGDSAAAARWWAEHREDPEEHDEEEFRLISVTDLRAGLRNHVRLHLNELLLGDWSGIDEFPEMPDNHLATFLIDDLVDLALARMGDEARIYAGFLPVAWPPEIEDDDLQTTVLLVAGDEVAVLEVDLSC